jgi:hypothetical protein
MAFRFFFGKRPANKGCLSGIFKEFRLNLAAGTAKGALGVPSQIYPPQNQRSAFIIKN